MAPSDGMLDSGTVDHGGVSIHYDVVGEGPPLVLQHGRLGSGRFWVDAGYTKALAPSRRLVMIDARGHGRSGKPHDPAVYRAEDMAGDVVAVLDALGIERADFFGYSMGGRIGFATMAGHPDRINALVAGGAGPYGPARTAEGELEVAAALSGGMAGYLDAMERLLNRAMPSADREVMMGNDADALAALATATASWTPVVAGLVASGRPICLFGGTKDPIWELIQQADGELANAELHAIGPFGHGEDLRKPELVLPLVIDFLDRHGLAGIER